ncbi:MAG: hypothetical protein NUW01_13835 [Gemmatimonadaceae bacterium]|nr:hypothetical protein [Gemmatimonadaceae bacterium]
MSVTVGPNCPELVFEIDFDTDPGATPRTYTDVSSDVRALSYIRGGRAHELQRSDAGSLTAVLDNRSGDYDPTNALGAYYPGVKRMRWCRVKAVWATVTYIRWTGLIESWRQEWPSGGTDATVTVRAVDAFKVLNLYDLDGLSYALQTTDVRVAAVCASVGLPSTVDTDAATTIVESGTFAADTMALSHLLAIEESENGLLYAGSDGTIVFQGRYYRLLNSSTSKGTIGDAAGEIPYRTGELDLDDADLWDSAAVTPSGGTPETATDSASIAAHYERTLNRGILAASQTEALSAAQFLVERYADQAPRIPQVELVGQADTSKWPVILAAVNSDRFTWHRSAVADIEQDVFVERVSDVVVPGTEWRVAFELSPAADQAGWVLGDPTYSLLGETTVLVY